MDNRHQIDVEFDWMETTTHSHKPSQWEPAALFDVAPGGSQRDLMTSRFVRLMMLCCGCMFTVLAVLSPRHAAANEDTCIPGTYLIVQEDGTQSLWTLARHGDVHITSSAEAAFTFSHEQGVWKQSGFRKAKTMTLDFTFGTPVNGRAPPAEIARVDALLTLSKQCQRVEGSFELRFFDPQQEDPLEPMTDTGDVVVMTFTGRRLTID